ncbi:unnamed protein product [Peronospora belbahrii]|uniref:Uncharacterized protein n=1 Tax=Peronospora belbahrii TaxID=622444 RepID=A0AAU9L241_9STRA|nr:unnamed protein product [Peronospora belbahrii]CAH0521042.1 unnamed protein product [Peronospora belbahrii]
MDTKVLTVSVDASQLSSNLQEAQQMEEVLLNTNDSELYLILPDAIRIVKVLSRAAIKYVAVAAADTQNVTILVALDDTLLPIVRLFQALLDKLTCQELQDDKELRRWLPFVLTTCYFLNGAELPGADLMESVVLANKVLNKAAVLTRSKDRQSLVAKYVAEMVALCTHNVDKQEWVAVTSVNKKIMLRVVEQVSIPYLGGDLLGRLLALTFPLVDDLTDSTQFIGARMLRHIIKNVTPTELRWYSDVLLEVLHTAIVSRKPDTLDVLLECLVESLDIISSPSELKHYDRFMPRILSDTSLCSDVTLRIVFVRHLHMLVVRQGAPHSLNLIRYLQPLLKVLVAGFESVNVALLVENLKTLRETVLAAWPRIAPHTEQILVGVLRVVAFCVLFDEGTDFTPSMKQQEQLLAQCEDVMDLLHQVNGAKSVVSDMLELVKTQSLKLSPFCNRMQAKWVTR